MPAFSFRDHAKGGSMSNFCFVSKIPIEKGWSGDKKYCVISEEGIPYLLRITPESNAERARAMFQWQKLVEAQGVSMCKPITWGRCHEGIYTLYSWIKGLDAERVIPQLQPSQQYALGRDAGVMLKKIHTIAAPTDQPDWETRFNAKVNRKIQQYRQCPVQYPDGEAFIDYIESHRSCLKHRPQCYQHGDYHIGNMMIEDGKLIIIDFDRYDFGDPWEEFNRIVWSAQLSPLFASGMLQGYFSDQVPGEFWTLLAFYIASNTLGSLPWAVPYGDKEVAKFLKQGETILDWYDHMQQLIPSWYTNDI